MVSSNGPQTTTASQSFDTWSLKLHRQAVLLPTPFSDFIPLPPSCSVFIPRSSRGAFYVPPYCQFKQPSLGSHQKASNDSRHGLSSFTGMLFSFPHFPWKKVFILSFLMKTVLFSSLFICSYSTHSVCSAQMASSNSPQMATNEITVIQHMVLKVTLESSFSGTLF